VSNLNINNIKVGDRIKNYKELCKRLDEKETTGKSKIIQIKDFQRYFSYEMNGREFIINEVYSNPIEKAENGNIVYQGHLELLLLDYLAKRRYSDSFNLIELTVKDIAVITAMCKRDYINKTFEELQEENPEITRYDHNELRRRFETKIHKTIDQMLAKLGRDLTLYLDTSIHSLKHYLLYLTKHYPSTYTTPLLHTQTPIQTLDSHLFR